MKESQNRQEPSACYSSGRGCSVGRSSQQQDTVLNFTTSFQKGSLPRRSRSGYLTGRLRQPPRRRHRDELCVLLKSTVA
eukprot:5468205-Alexandrium_andersonii.AAC.1